MTGGLVLDTSLDSIAASFAAHSKAKKLSSSAGGIASSLGKGFSLEATGLADRFGLGALSRRS